LGFRSARKFSLADATAGGTGFFDRLFAIRDLASSLR
jgi:hypothetical protein